MASSSSSSSAISKPPGFSSVNDNNVEEAPVVMSKEMQIAAIQKQAMTMAYSPAKGVFTTAFMLWMSGSSIQIFSIMMTGMALINPLKAIFGTNKMFAAYEKQEGVDLKIPKLIFIFFNIIALLVGIYKTHTMGLLPVTSGDWTSYIPEKVYTQTAAIPL